MNLSRVVWEMVNDCDKKALSIIKNIYTISEDEGKKAQQFYDKY